MKRFIHIFILIDINLSGKNGIDFARELRKYDRDMRMIISTAVTKVN